MCGIAGFTGHVENHKALIHKMTEVITHRGPDSNGFYYGDDQVTMGFRRLSIIDIEQRGDQPIYNEDRSMVITFNGEIYNYQELREQLVALGHQFTTETDTEVILHGFEQWQEGVLDHLRGMFGFAIWNTVTGELFIARDFFGIKPMHYCMVNDHFVYGSEIVSLLEFPGLEKKLDKRALDLYLSFEYVFPPMTMFEGIQALLPGHYLWYRNGQIETHRYWRPEFDEDKSITEEQAVDAIDAAFTDSVAKHRIADVEVGCFLSGGVDSNFVASYFGGQKSFTVGFGDDERYDENMYAAPLAERIGLDHHYKRITPEEYWNSIRFVQYRLGQPSADASCIALYHLSTLASQYVKVVLSGEGSDELFGGYNIYHEPDDLASFQNKVPKSVRKALSSVAQAVPWNFRGKSFLRRAASSTEERFIGNCSMISVQQKRAMLRPEIPVSKPQDVTAAIYDEVKDKDDLTKMQYLDLNVWMVGDILLKADRMSMANSLELRVPFLDKEVWEVARHLPKNLRCNEQNTKYALRKAAQRHIPQDNAQKKKLGFPVPIREWLKDDAYYQIVKSAFVSDSAKQYFQTDELVRMLDEHKSGKSDLSRQIWTVYMFLIWYDVYFNDAPHENGTSPVFYN